MNAGKLFLAILLLGAKCKLFLVHLMCSHVKEAEYSYRILFGKSERHLWCLLYIRCSATFFHNLYCYMSLCINIYSIAYQKPVTPSYTCYIVLFGSLIGSGEALFELLL